MRCRVLRTGDFAEWLDTEARGTGVPEFRAASVLGAACVAYTNLATWPDLRRLRGWESGRELAPSDRVADVESYGEAIRGTMPTANFEGWNTVFGRWYLSRFLVDRDWGDDAAAVADLVEKGRTMLRAPVSK
ncbi:MAG: hypothetical protein HMLKMBBP_01467 [Planctomycetes bacterium]|nr:hypothetical protein [Planctomycetota bacterium]